MWDPEPQTWNASGWDNVDDIQDYMTYDIDSPGCYIGPEEGVGFMEVGGWETGYPLPWQEPPIEDEQDCLALHDHSGSILGNRQEATDWVSMIMARSASCGVADVPGAASPLVGWALLGEAFLAV